jgi:tetratricopeptide (TPR) repeat protein
LSPNHYNTLGISPRASAVEIKRSFRRRAKELHPDTALVGSDERMRSLIDAYEVLSDPQRRHNYDRTHASLFRTVTFDYREFLRQRRHDYVSQSKLIFYDLLNSHDEEALETYEQLIMAHIDLRKYMSHEDFMDCSFLLAEAFERRGDLVRSADLYRRLYLYERERPYFHHFVDEVVDRLRTLICFKMVPHLPADLVVAHIENLIDMDISRKDSAFFHKKIAEIYSSNGDNDRAAEHLRRGLALDTKLAGVKKLKEKIGFPELATT